MRAVLTDDPAPRMTAAKLLEGRNWCALHALEDDEIRAGRTVARDSGWEASEAL